MKRPISSFLSLFRKAKRSIKRLTNSFLSLFRKATRRKKNPLAKRFDYEYILEIRKRIGAARSTMLLLLGRTPIDKRISQGAGYDQRDVLGRKNTFLFVENILHFQNPDGGWGKRGDYTINYSKKQLKKIYQAPDSHDLNGENIRVSSDFDNECTWGHIHYLAQVYRSWPDECIKESIEKGLKFIVRSQHKKSNSWENKNHRHITYNDGVMTGVLGLLLDILHNTSFQYLAGELDLENVYLRGIDCILKTQIKRANGKFGIWAQQHDHETLEPVWARSYEMPAYATSESVGVIKLLQRHRLHYDENAADIDTRIESAIKFLRELQLFNREWEGYYDPRKGKPFPTGRPIWARFYDLNTERPIFANRGREIVRNIKEVKPERLHGYGWFITAAESLM